MLTRQAATIAVAARENLNVRVKSDGSLVTDGDKRVEEWLLPRLVALTPGAGMWGEEGTYAPVTESGFWVLDPIDGTSNYCYGQPLWGVTAAFMRHGKLVAGTIVMPELNIAMLAVQGGGVFVNGRELPPIPAGGISPVQLVGHGSTNHISRYADIGKARHLGAFVVEGFYVAAQMMRAMTTNRVKLYDAAAGILAVRELGGLVCHLDGSEFFESKWTEDVRCSPLFIGPIGSNFPFDRA